MGTLSGVGIPGHAASPSHVAGRLRTSHEPPPPQPEPLGASPMRRRQALTGLAPDASGRFQEVPEGAHGPAHKQSSANQHGRWQHEGSPQR